MKESDHEFRELLDRYLKGTATQADREILEQFFESYQAEAKGQEIIRDEVMLRDRLLHKIHQRVDKNEKPRRRMVAWWLPLAAAIAVFVVAYFFIYRFESRQVSDARQAVLVSDSTGPAQRIVKVLPDGSTAHLNNRTTLTYPESFGAVRQISITGEGFFKVVNNGKPFVVRSGGIKTQVLGTSFNVKHREGSDTEITLEAGKVDVISSKGESLNLEPGEQAVLREGSETMTKRSVNVMRYAGWKDNILLFEQTTFEQAIREIEEWYAVDIDIADHTLRQCTITARYQNEPLGNVLSSLQFLLALNVTRLSDTSFLIEGNGCK